jgi:hypothetical protein
MLAEVRKSRCEGEKEAETLPLESEVKVLVAPLDSTVVTV